MERREDVSEEYVQFDSLLFITCPIVSPLRDLLDDPRVDIKDPGVSPRMGVLPHLTLFFEARAVIISSIDPGKWQLSMG